MPPVPGDRHRSGRSKHRAAHRQHRTAAEADRVVAVLYRAHYQSLARIAALLVSDASAAEEIVQSAFVSLHRARPHPDDEDRALAYLRRAVVSATRSRDTAPAGSPSRPGGVPHASWPGHSIPGTLLVAALQALPHRQREALVLRYYAQWPDAQIAAAMGISGRAVVRQAERGISTLRACGGLD
jgi:DNA-directed RNA polymerase specialized sigma24 family protein